MAYKFEDKFVHFRWDDSLKGKKVFCADCISTLEYDVAEGEDYRELLRYSGNKTCPFTVKSSDGEHDNNWQFVYYDPNYEVKLAYEEGKKIQYRAIDTGDWCDWNNSLGICPFLDAFEYRIKPMLEAYVFLKQIGSVLRLLWNFDKVEESCHKYFRGLPSECCTYIESHNKFAPLMKAWEDGKVIQFKRSDGVWEDLSSPAWVSTYEYRVKPDENEDKKVLEWTDLEVGDFITNGKTTAIITAIDSESYPHIFIGYRWLVDVELEDWRKVKNG